MKLKNKLMIVSVIAILIGINLCLNSKVSPFRGINFDCFFSLNEAIAEDWEESCGEFELNRSYVSFQSCGCCDHYPIAVRIDEYTRECTFIEGIIIEQIFEANCQKDPCGECGLHCNG